METKKWYESKTMWAGLVALLAGAASMLGYTFSEADQNNLVEYITGGFSVVAAIYAMYGRAKATKVISKQ